MELKDMIEKCKEYGALKATLINVDEIPFDKKLRSYCEANYCGKYGKNYACPPSIGDVESVIAEAKGYKKALVFQTVSQIKDSFDLEGMDEAARRHSLVADRINEDLQKDYDGYLKLTAGGCAICPVCAQAENQPCRHPGKAISSLEAYCINVVALSKFCDMNYINGQNTVTYFGAFLFK